MKRIFLAMLPILFLAACTKNKPPITPIPNAIAKEVLPEKEEIILKAMAKDDVVYIEVVNKLNQPLPAFSRMFGVIDQQNRKLIRWDDKKNRTWFPPSKLEPGQSAIGRIQFKGPRLVGSKLVFYPKPISQPVYAWIKPYKDTTLSDGTKIDKATYEKLLKEKDQYVTN